MPSFRLGLIALLLLPNLALAQDKKKTVEQLAEEAKDSIAVLLYSGREGKTQGIGTGFVVTEDGLIATNLHVIGEARPITVQLADGSKHDATIVHASDRKFDLAVVKIDAKKKLKPLVLGDSTKLPQGLAIVAIGHPRGLQHSVVAGVLSGKRDIDGVSMLQLAIPIEQGNSGGPVLDPQGRVVGVVTLQSRETANLGYAVPVNSLKQILDRPNPVTMEQWLTIGALDKTEWKTMYGARWRQRAGRILADGAGTGFGGRTLCFSQRKAPDLPHELTVTVKLDHEGGAAGLIFGGDGGDKHYGFYPTGGKLRLTRFDGANVFSWQILFDQKSDAYRAGDWNTLRVRLGKEKILCYVNDVLVTDLANPEYYGSAFGLAKFRDTVAEYKKFQIGPSVASAIVSPDNRLAFEKSLAKIPLEGETAAKALTPLLKNPTQSGMLLRDKARQLEKQAEQLRLLAQRVHHERCLAEMTELFKAPEEKVDLARAALLLARLDNEELEVDFYVAEIDRLARIVAARLPAKTKADSALQELNKFLFKERGFHGSHSEYYSKSNSYLNEVIDDREGLPITLSVLYIELARRLKLNVVGVPLPGHFAVRHEPASGKTQIIDVFDGKPLSRADAESKVKKITGRPAEDDDFKAATKRSIIIRMARNLVNVAKAERDGDGMLRYLDIIVALDKDAHEDRWMRAYFRAQGSQPSAALEDCEYLLEHAPPGFNLDLVREMRAFLLKKKS
ncbi:MAG: trypsin-like serine protease [Planctomycetes bacterium]|nr:trypsin-like serine protease [Planctomycetota bacterium]